MQCKPPRPFCQHRQLQTRLQAQLQVRLRGAVTGCGYGVWLRAQLPNFPAFGQFCPSSLYCAPVKRNALNPTVAAGLVEDTAAHLTDCRLCPHLCGPRRAEGRGVCRVGVQSYVASEMLHMGEEDVLRPAHAIFFSGCTATCSFCTAARFAFRPTYGAAVSAEQLGARILQRQAEGARSVCFIGGDPGPHIPIIVETLARLGERRTIPAVFNSNFYLTAAALDLLAP